MPPAGPHGPAGLVLLCLVLQKNPLLMPLEKYEELRNFFSAVQNGDGDQAVLRPESDLKVQSQN